MKVSEKAQELGINPRVLIASKFKPHYKIGRLEYDEERFDGSWSGCGSDRTWKPDTTYYVWDALDEYAVSVGCSKSYTLYNPTNAGTAGFRWNTMLHVSVPQKIKEPLIYFKMINNEVQQCIDFQYEEINISLDKVKNYIERNVNPSSLKNLIDLKYTHIDVKPQIFENEKIAEAVVEYECDEPIADTIEEGFALIGWKPYKFFDNIELFKTREWTGNEYICGFKVVGKRIEKKYKDMSFKECIETEEQEISSYRGEWRFRNSMPFEGELNEYEAQKAYFNSLNERPYKDISLEEAIKKGYYGSKIKIKIQS